MGVRRNEQRHGGQQIEELESDPTVWVKIDPAQVRHTVVALRVMAPNALRPIEDLIPIVYPGVRMSYSRVIFSIATGTAYCIGIVLMVMMRGAVDAPKAVWRVLPYPCFTVERWRAPR